MSDSLLIRSILGDGPFAHIGEPQVAERDEARQLVAVGGYPGLLQWPGRDVQQRRRAYRIGIYALDGLTCRHLVPSSWPVHAVAFHPSLPLLAVGTGAYDGGYFFEGELLIVDLESGRVVSALDGRREVRQVRWRDDRVLELVLMPYDDDEDKWVVAVDPPASADGPPVVRRLFPLEWDAERGGHLFGGPAVCVSDAGGSALVHAGAVHDGAGLPPGRAFVTRRRLPDGQPQWVFPADHVVTALDTDGRTVYAAFNSGEVVALDASDGSVRWRQSLLLGGVPAEPLSLAAGQDRLLIGTVDGRIIDCALPEARGPHAQ